jgi:LPPG:FO 2-phospho-L-lactate transferase
MSTVVLTGGVGGAKFVLGLQHCIDPASVTAIVNTADDFEHLGLYVSPDIDTLLYTLSGQSNQAQGWGRENESWQFMEVVRSLGEEDWFRLGDGDLALHVLRSMRLRRGEALSDIIADFVSAWNIGPALLPMTNDPVATIVHTNEGILPFQHYFVRRKCEPEISAIGFDGAARAMPAPGVIEAIRTATAIFIAPSNPFLSIDPILSVPGLRVALETAKAPVVAISPIVGGKAVKGPTSKIMTEFDIPHTNASIAAHYTGIIDGLLVDVSDDVPAECETHATQTLMQTLQDRIHVAREALLLARRLV